ncbi:MAG: VPLPA-CTERM sorting domain-containing protein [Paracoccaceae bacterium]
MRLTGFLAFCLAAPALSASALTFSEPSDLSGPIGSETQIGTLDLGLNQVSGSISATCDVFATTCTSTGFSGDQFDAFGFDIAPGTELVSAFLTITNLDADQNGTPEVRVRASPPLRPLGAFQQNLTVNLLSGVPLTDSQVFEVSSQLRGNGAVGETVSFDWQVDLQVEAVQRIPVPAALPLLLTGLGALVVIRRRA